MSLHCIMHKMRADVNTHVAVTNCRFKIKWNMLSSSDLKLCHITYILLLSTPEIQILQKKCRHLLQRAMHWGCGKRERVEKCSIKKDRTQNSRRNHAKCFVLQLWLSFANDETTTRNFHCQCGAQVKFTLYDFYAVMEWDLHAPNGPIIANARDEKNYSDKICKS